jgi:hypothetical protein
MTNRRRATVVLPHEAIAAVLELPTGLEVHHLFLDPFRDALCVAVTGEHLDEVAEGTEPPRLPTPEECYVVDTTPVLDALRNLHRPTDDGLLCLHCEDYEWPCPTMKAAEGEALTRPLVVRRLKVVIN